MLKELGSRVLLKSKTATDSDDFSPQAEGMTMNEEFGDDTVCAISTQWGRHTPGVQHNRLDEDAVAIVFKTPTKPEYGFAEEVV